MRHELLPLKYAQSLISDGNFTEGVSHWFGQYIRHINMKGIYEGSNFSNSPGYAVQIQGGAGSSHYEDIPAGIHQFIDRDDIYTYPSVRYVERVEMKPLREDSAILNATTNSRINGNVFVEGDPGRSDILGYAQHPFLYQGPDGKKSPQVGSEFSLEGGQAGSGRIGVFLEDTSKQRHEFANHRLLVYLAGHKFTPIIGSSLYPTVTVRFGYNPTTNSGIAYFEGQGFESIINTVRPDGTTGLKPGDIISLEDLNLSLEVRLAGNANQPTSYNIEYKAIPGTPPIMAGSTSFNWNVFTPTTVNMVLTLPTFQYDYTLGVTYNLNAAPTDPATPEMTYRVISQDGTLRGIGEVADFIPMRKEVIVPLQQVNSVGAISENNQWVRKLYRFCRDAVAPVNGRLLLTIKPPATGVAAERTAIIGDVALFKFDRTSLQPIDNTSTGLQDQTAALDPMVPQINPLNNIIPKGALVLYVGAGDCPPGFKRISSFVFSAPSEQGLRELRELPTPSVALYDDATDLTTLGWPTTSFERVDVNGNPVPLKNFQAVVEYPIPGAIEGAVQPIIIIPDQQIIQPGMSVRKDPIVAVPAEMQTQGYREPDVKAPYEGLGHSHLIVAQDYIYGGQIEAQGSAAAYHETRLNPNPQSGLGNGSGVILYPNIQAAEFGVDSTYPEIPPAGPPRSEQTLIFPGAQPAAIWRINDRDTSNVFGVFEDRLQVVQVDDNVSYTPNPLTPNIPANTTGNIALLSTIQNGDVLFAEMYGTITGSNGLYTLVDSFLCRVYKYPNLNNEWAIYRYDGRPIKALGFDNQVPFEPDNIIGVSPPLNQGLIIARPAKLYGFEGVRQRLLPSTTGNVLTPQGHGKGYIQQKLNIGGELKWITRLIEYGVQVKVTGNITPVTSSNFRLLLEPSGYLRFDDSGSGVDYGAGGHAHIVKDGTTSSIEVPHIRLGHPASNLYPEQFCPSNHGHGAIGAYVFPLPAAVVYTLCQKL